MESASHRLQVGQKKQDEIRRQIALLQAQLLDLPDEEQSSVAGVKRKQDPTDSRGSTSILAPATPSPKKKRKREIVRDASKHAERRNASPTPSSKPTILSKGQTTTQKVPAPSTLLNRLAALTNDEPHHDAEEERNKPSRSASFTSAAPSTQSAHARPKRNEDLTIVEDMEPGPYEHNPPLDDPNFDRLEPHSGIRLLSRAIPHEDISEYMRGRCYLSPSRLYSCVRLSADKQSYDVPFPGDWVTIAVVAEIGEVKYTRAPVSLGPDEDEKKKLRKKNKSGGKGKEEQCDEENTRSGGKRYVNVRLVDFGARSKGSETGGAGIIRGDACLTMLLFESDRFEWLEPGDEEQQEGSKKKKVKIYKGGSKGAFESMHKLRHGDVVALLNPRVLKPFQRNSTSSVSGNSSLANTLAVSPESAGAILLVGRSRDFGRCNARKRDGQQCGSWCDTRVSEVCDWHMQRAVESRRAGRAEFSAGTTGMSTSAAVRKGRKRAEEFDPEKQWGLMPNGSSNGGGATYVLSGHVISSSQSSDIFVGEKMGREAQARAQRKAAGQEVEKALKQLMERDKDGMRSVFRAREVGDAMVKEGKTRKQESGKEKEKKATKEKKEEPAVQDEIKTIKSLGYSVGVIKGIGFDPAALSATSLTGTRKNVETGSAVDKLQVLAKLQEAKKERGFNLKPRAGERVRSGVVAPGNDKNIEEAKQEGMVDLDDL